LSEQLDSLMPKIKIGAIFPQTEIGHDPAEVSAYAQAVEELGFDYLTTYEHVIGANPASRPGWQGAYDVDSRFYEPFILLSHIAAVTKVIGLAMGVLVLPQRQTVLVAKQAASLDVLSSGRLRLGVGIGWNAVEYEALGQEFNNRGRRVEEQIDLMRRLWTNRAITFGGKWHSVVDAGINPLPTQRPIPIWLGGSADAVVKRVAAIADGWTVNFEPDVRGRELCDRMREAAVEAGREPSKIGLEGNIRTRNGDASDWGETLERWRTLGATHVSVHTMGDGLAGADAHVERLRAAMETFGRA
jgi:probable F420-dependent oxidoreductase